MFCICFIFDLYLFCICLYLFCIGSVFFLYVCCICSVFLLYLCFICVMYLFCICFVWVYWLMDYILLDHYWRPYALARTEEPVSTKFSSTYFSQQIISPQWRPCWILKFTVTTNCMEGAKLPVLLLSVRYEWRCSENLRKTSFKIRRRKGHFFYNSKIITEGLSVTPLRMQIIVWALIKYGHVPWTNTARSILWFFPNSRASMTARVFLYHFHIMWMTSDVILIVI